MADSNDMVDFTGLGRTESLDRPLWEAVGMAFRTVHDGGAKRIDLVDGITVYSSGSIVRIDIKKG